MNLKSRILATAVLCFAAPVFAASTPSAVQADTAVAAPELTPVQATQRLSTLKDGLVSLQSGQLPEAAKEKVQALESDVRSAEKKVATALQAQPEAQKEAMSEIESTLIDLERRYAQVSNATPTSSNN